MKRSSNEVPKKKMNQSLDYHGDECIEGAIWLAGRLRDALAAEVRSREHLSLPGCRLPDHPDQYCCSSLLPPSSSLLRIICIHMHIDIYIYKHCMLTYSVYIFEIYSIYMCIYIEYNVFQVQGLQ